MNISRDAIVLAHGELTEQIIGAFYEVYNDLGMGFVESVYSRALQIALSDRGLSAEREVPVTVRFRQRVVGDFRIDLIVNEQVIVELKAVEKIITAHERQIRNYLRASGLSVGLILNIADRPQVRRMIWTVGS